MSSKGEWYYHRGWTGDEVPENTLGAVERLDQTLRELDTELGHLEFKGDVELDLRKTKDGELIVFHDKFLEDNEFVQNYNEDVRGPVHQKKLDELREIDLDEKGQTVPTFSEYLEYVEEKVNSDSPIQGIRAHIKGSSEIDYTEGDIKYIRDELEKRDLDDRTIIHSETPDILEPFAEEYTTSLIVKDLTEIEYVDGEIENPEDDIDVLLNTVKDMGVDRVTYFLDEVTPYIVDKTRDDWNLNADVCGVSEEELEDTRKIYEPDQISLDNPGYIEDVKAYMDSQGKGYRGTAD